MSTSANWSTGDVAQVAAILCASPLCDPVTGDLKTTEARLDRAAHMAHDLFAAVERTR